MIFDVPGYPLSELYGSEEEMIAPYKKHSMIVLSSPRHCVLNKKKFPISNVTQPMRSTYTLNVQIYNLPFVFNPRLTFLPVSYTHLDVYKRQVQRVLNRKNAY